MKECGGVREVHAPDAAAHRAHPLRGDPAPHRERGEPRVKGGHLALRPAATAALGPHELLQDEVKGRRTVDSVLALLA